MRSRRRNKNKNGQRNPSSLARPLALVTGASSGIGYEIALELAACGYDLLATGRDATRLEQLEVECRERSGRSVEYHSLDLGAPDGAQRLVSHWRDRLSRVEVLVNNAGFSVPGPFASSPIDKEIELTRVQIDAMLTLTKAIIPGMIARREGWVLNVASAYSFFPVPYQSVYGASKSFMLSFSSALGFELAEKGVRVTALCPGLTRTRFRTRRGIVEKAGGMSAESVARIGCRDLFAGKRVVVPGLFYRMLVLLATWAPRSLTLAALTRINRSRGLND